MSSTGDIQLFNNCIYNDINCTLVSLLLLVLTLSGRYDRAERPLFDGGVVYAARAQTAMAASSVFRPGLFKHKVAIVTGGGTGIGKAISSELLELGKSSYFLITALFL